METTPSKQDILNAALDHVYASADALVDDFARRFALENMGQTLADHLHYKKVKPEHVYSACWNDFYQGSESDETAAGLDAERKAWLKGGKRLVKLVQKKGLPLTMRNAEDAWHKRGPFAG